MKTPTIEEISKAFANFCRERECTDCKFVRYNLATCKAIFVYEVLTGKLNLDGTPVAEKAEATEKTGNVKDLSKVCENAGQANLPPLEGSSDVRTPKPKLPKWCKVGQWVMADDELCVIHRVYGTILETKRVVDSPYSSAKYYHCHKFRPVRFRPYTYEEAKRLLGKVLEYKWIEKHTTIVTRISDGSGYEGGTVSVDGFSQEWFVEHEATIDGHPFGVPEIDEEAEKEEQK